VSIGTSTWDAGFTFNNDGTGSAEGTLRSIPLMGDPFGPLPVGSGVPMPFTYQFTYTVTKEGAITFTLVPHTYIVAGGAACFDAIPKDGAISGDGKTITIACGAPVVLTFIDCKTFAPSTAQNLCNASLVLIKQ
jgi:hypothetical protein